MHFMPKSIYLFITRITEDNAYMWLPLAFQVKYLDFYICFIAYRVVPGSSCGHKLLCLILCHLNWFIASGIACMPNIHCI